MSHNFAVKVMATNNSVKMYFIGQNIDKFDEDMWQCVCNSIMLEWFMSKFSDLKLKAYLLRTGHKHIAKSNGKDSYWGTTLYMTQIQGISIGNMPSNYKRGQWNMKTRDHMYHSYIYME